MSSVSGILLPLRLQRYTCLPKAVMNTKWHNKDMSDILAYEAAALNCRTTEVGTGVSKTFNYQKEKKICSNLCGRRVGVVLDGPVSKR